MNGASAFPAPIAGAIQAWEAEPVLFRRQARLIACFEALIQYAAIVAVSEFHRAGLDREFPDVDALIRDVIHRPSTGTWQRIYREAAGAFRGRRAALVCDAIYRFGFDDAGRQTACMRAADEITRFRNEQKGHGHVLLEEEYAPLLARHEANLRTLLDAAAFARELTLCVVIERSPRGILAGRLMGPVESAGPRDEYPPADDAPPPGHVAARHRETGRWIDLSPLLLYLECEREVERLDRRGERTRERCGRPGVFFHHELLPPSRVRGFEYRYSHHSSWRFPDFDFVGQYLQRYSRRAGSEPEAEWYTSRISEATRYFVGREEPLERLTRLARGAGPHRVAFVVGLPGFGKSTLLARWIAQVDADGTTTPGLHAFRHFIQEPYPESGRASNVFDILRLQVCDRFGLDPKPPYPDGRVRADRYRAALLESLAVALKQGGQPRIALVIDGLDEALRVTAGEDDAILDWLPGPDRLPPGVTLILSGRPNVKEVPAFQSRYGRGATEYIELSRLAESEVREWFVLAFGPVYALEQEPFLERVAAAARGHPQYLHFVHRALMDGTLQVGDSETLPAGLEEFYARVVQEAVGAEPAALGVIGLLAAAAAPLDLATMAAVLGERVDNVANACDAARNVLEWDATGHVLLFDAEFAEWVRGGQGQGGATDALRRETFAAMSARLLAWCRDWATHRNPYAAANLVKHLVDTERHDEVAGLARNHDFLAFQASARPDAPDLPQATFRAALYRAAQSGDHPATVELGLHRVAWATAMLAESPLDAFQTGSRTRARRLADLHEPVERLSWYFVLAHEILQRDGAAAAEQFLGLPGRLPWWPAGRKATGTMTQAADALIRLHPLPSFVSLWRFYLDDPARSRLAANLVTFGRADLATQIVDEVPFAPHRDQALIRLAGALAEQGEYDRAYRLADIMWSTESRWTARERVAEAAAPKIGLDALESARREASRDPVAQDALVKKVALAFDRAGMVEEAGVAAERIENRHERDQALGAFALGAIGRGDFRDASRWIAKMRRQGPLHRALLDRAFLSAVRRGRLGGLAPIFGADGIAKPLAIALALLAVGIPVVLPVAASVPRLSGLAGWGPVLWLTGAFSIAIGLRRSSWRAGVSALIWSGLTATSMHVLSGAGPLGVVVAMLGGGIALGVAAIVAGVERLQSRLRWRIAAVAGAAIVVGGILTAFAGPGLAPWAADSVWLEFAVLLPAGAALGIAAFSGRTVQEERMALHAGALLPALVLATQGVTAATTIPSALAAGWLAAALPWGLVFVLSNVGVLARLLRPLALPGSAAVYFAVAEVMRAGIASVEYDRVPKGDDLTGTMVTLTIAILMVGVVRRQTRPAPQESPTDEAPASRFGSRSLIDLTRNPGERKARFRAELLLRLARLFPKEAVAAARDTTRAAAQAAAALSSTPDELDRLEEPVRRDLLWLVAREAWRRRDLATAARAAWLVEWRRWSGMITGVSATATGVLLGLTLPLVLNYMLGEAPRSILAAAVAVASVSAVLVTTPRLRSLRESILALPLTAIAATWTLSAGDWLTKLVPLGLAMLFAVIGAPGSGSVSAWVASLALVWRRQLLLAIPAGYLAAAIVALKGGAPWPASRDLFLSPLIATSAVVALSMAFDTTLQRASRRLLPRKPKDLPAAAESPADSVAVFERATFSDEVGTAVVGLAAREPAALEGIARAAVRAA